MLAGCAGWSIPTECSAAFPAAGSHLERYAAVFGAVEINSSFYRPHRASTYARWADSVPDDFVFSVKLPRAITHEARLVGIDAVQTRFLGEVSALGAKLGCVLVQLPPSLAFDARVAGEFFAGMRARFSCVLACEARHRSWFSEAATDLLISEGITRVYADPPKGQEGAFLATTGTLYARLHGSPRIYYSSYDSAYLKQVAAGMQQHTGAGRTVWTIFDNTASGAAVANALQVVAIAPPGASDRQT